MAIIVFVLLVLFFNRLHTYYVPSCDPYGIFIGMHMEGNLSMNCTQNHRRENDETINQLANERLSIY